MVYQIDAPFAPWLWPILELLGIALELLGLAFNKSWLLPTGFIILATGCWQERDISLACGDALACLGLFVYLKKKSGTGG